MKFMTPRQYGQLIIRVIFNGRTLLAYTEKWTKSEVVASVVQANIYTFIFALLIMGLISLFYNLIFSFWIVAGCISGCIVLGVACCISAGIEGSLLWGVLGGGLGGVLGTIIASIAEGFKFGIFYATLIGIIIGFSLSVTMSTNIEDEWSIKWNLGVGLLLGFLFSAALLPAVGFFAFFFLISYLIFWSRWFYLPFFLIAIIFQIKNPRILPSHWDENICIPLPLLKKALLNISIDNRTSIIDEALFLINERPAQRKASQKFMMEIAVEEMVKFRDLRNIADMKQELDFLPQDTKAFPEYFNRWYEELLYFSANAKKVQSWLTFFNRLEILNGLLKDLRDFQRKMDLVEKRIRKPFRMVSTRWLEILDKEIKFIEADISRLLPNPFIVGKPISAESEMFLGRQDIIQQIQQEALREDGAGAVLFIGSRRTGKTSTLLNLKRYLLTSLKPVFVDFQDPAVSSNLKYFCETLAKSISNSANIKRDQLTILPDLAALTEYLKKIQLELRANNKYLLLCFDEYERMTEKIISGEFQGLPDAFRHWIQHLPRTICLFAGSHALNEIEAIDWTDHFINVRTVRISFLDFDSALRLVTEPIPKFDMQYESGVKTAKKLVRRLGCQPFLLQATMSELVNHLNTLHRKTAAQADIDIAIEKLFDSQSTYFEHIWKTETSEREKAVLQAIIKQQPMPKESDSAVRSLIRKEVLRKEDNKLVFCVPVFREWILKNQVF